MPIRAAAARIQATQVKILMICDEDQRLLGTLTDGDIRRAVSQGENLEQSVSAIMNRSPKVADESEPDYVVRARMRALVVREIPKVDKNHRVVGLVELHPEDSLPSPEATIVIMAGGRGSRLRPLTDTMPKPMVKIGGVPVIERQVEAFIRQGFHHFYISVNYLGHMIEEHFGDGSRFGVEIEYVYETEPLGTCGALSLLPPQSKPLIVINGDILTRTDFNALLKQFNSDDVAATIGVREHHYRIPYGCVTLDDNRVVALREKPTFWHLVNAGLYVFSPDAIAELPAGERYDTPQLIEKLINDDRHVNSFRVTEEWIDIGSHEDLLWAQQVVDKESAGD